MPSLDIICDLGLAVCLTASFLLWMRQRDHERRIKWLEAKPDKPRTEMERADREEGFIP